MPSSWPTDKAAPKKIDNALYVVGTPIGNLEDITLRALRVLNQVDCIAAEDTRKTNRLLSFYKIKNRLVSCHAYNEGHRTQTLIDRLLGGQSVAIVSNAGTPTVSDPGLRLIKAALDNGIDVIPIPGVSAPIAALSVAGMATDAFVFIGFPPKKKGKRHRLLHALAQESKTMIFFESARRLLSLLEELKAILGDRQVVLGREITKIHEEFLRGGLSDVRLTLEERQSLKGECTLLVAGEKIQTVTDMSRIRQILAKQIANPDVKLSSLTKEIAQEHGLAKSEVYQAALEVRAARQDETQYGSTRNKK